MGLLKSGKWTTIVGHAGNLVEFTLMFTQALNTKLMYRKLLPGLIALLFAVSAWSAPRPNILLVYMDDVGPAWLPPYAHRLTEEDVEEFVVNYYDEQRKHTFFH